MPSDVRERLGLTEGTVLVLVESNGALVLLPREQLLERVRRDLAGVDLVTTLLDDRRAAAAAEDAA